MPPSAEPSVLRTLRSDLTAAHFDTDAIAELLGPLAVAALHREQPLPAIRATEGGGALATLVRVFALGRTVPAVDLGRALPATGIDTAVRAGLVEASGDTVRATCDLRPYGEEDHSWWVASDLGPVASGATLPPDHVLGIGGASTTLAAWTPRRRVRRALDLGTGCAVQALHLSTHCAQVTATDTSSRALEYARFNAALAGVDLDLRRGSLLEPVRGEWFDLVVSNPPFVITPRGAAMPEYEYRDGGMTGDALVRDLVTSLPDVLAPGGVAQLLANWEVPGDTEWRTVVGGWLDGTGLDAWVVRRDEQDPAQYAELWASDAGHAQLGPGSPAYDAMYNAWLDDFAARGVRSIGFGVITLQRPEADRAPFRDLMDADGPVGGGMGAVVDAGLRARTRLAVDGEAWLLAGRWRVADDVTEERHGAPGAEDPTVIVLRQGGGLRRAVRLDTAAAAFVSVCDGALTASATLDAIADLLGEPAADVRAAVLPVLRELVADGLLLPRG